MNSNIPSYHSACSCGKVHTCPIESVVIGHGALQQLPELCAAYHSILLVADENTFRAAGEQAFALLKERTTRSVIFPGKPLLIPDENAIAAATDAMCGIDLILGVGSGVIQDLCKYVSQESGIPYSIIATAPSMDGYASSGAAMILGGMKVTVPAGLPIAIVADTAVLKNAPMEMIAAGYGDIIGKYSALNDWKLSQAVNGEYFCQEICDTVMRMVKMVENAADGLLSRKEDSIRMLMEALVIVGVMMSYAGNSRPASGSEHHLSHFFEITGIVRKEPYFPHGIDVAYSTVLTAKIREEMLQNAFADCDFSFDRSAYCQKMQQIYGPVAAGCIALQDQVGRYTENRIPVYRAKEQELRGILAEMPSAKYITGLLEKMGLQMADFTAMYSPEKLKNAVLYAKDLKDRYTVLWMYYDLFGDRLLDELLP